MATFAERLEALRKGQTKKITAQQQIDKAKSLYPGSSIDPVLKMRLAEKGLSKQASDLEGLADQSNVGFQLGSQFRNLAGGAKRFAGLEGDKPNTLRAPQIDPSLRQQLESRGMGERAQELQRGADLGRTATQLLPAIGGGVKDIFIEPATRDVAALGIEALSAFDQIRGKEYPQSRVYTPTTRLEKFVFGEEPVEGMGLQSEKWRQGAISFLKSKGVDEKTAEFLGNGLGPGALAGKVFLDFLLIGGTAEKAAIQTGQAVVRRAAPEIAAELVAKYGDEVGEVIARYGDDVAKGLLSKTDEEVAAFLRTEALKRAEAIEQASKQILELPEARIVTLRAGTSPRIARQTLEDIVKLEKQLIDEQAEALKLERLVAKLEPEDTVATREAISNILTRVREEAVPAQLARLERTLESSEASARALVSRFNTLTAKLPTALGEGLSQTFAPLVSKLDDVRFPQIEDAFKEATEALTDFSSLKGFGEVTDEVVDASLNEAKALIDNMGALSERVRTAEEALVGGGEGILQQELRRAQPQVRQVLSKQQRSQATKASQKLAQTRKRIREAESRLEALRSSEPARALQAGLQAGLTPQQVITPRGLVLTPDIVSEFKAGIKKDLSKLDLNMVFTAIDPIRAAEKVQGGVFGPLQKYVIGPAQELAAKANITLGREIKTFEGFLDNAGLVPPSYFGRAGTFFKRPQGPAREYYRRSAKLFRIAEGRGTKADLASVTPQERQVNDYVKAKYDQFLETINTQRRAINLKEIPRRQDYVSHLQKMTVLQDMGRSLVREEKISELIPEAVKKRSKISAFFEKERGLGDFDEDIVEAYLAYLPTANRMVHFERFAAETTALTELLPANAKSFFQTWVKEGVLNAQPEFDYLLNQIFPMRLSNLAARYSQATGKGTILGNVSTLILQPSTSLTLIPEVGLRDWIMGGMKTLDKKGIEFVRANSKVLQIRDFEGLSMGLTNKIEKGANYLNQSADKTMVVWSWLSAYRKASMRMGLNHADAVYYADNIAGKSQAIYHKMFSPRVFRSSAGGALAQFQRFGYNLWNRLRRDPFITAKEEGGVKALAKTSALLGSMWATNVAYQAMGLPSPYSFISQEGKAIEAVPVLGPAKTFGAPSVLRLPYDMAVLVLSEDTYKRKKAINDLRKIAFTLIPGGNQLRKSLEGLAAISDGYYQVGKQRIPIEGAAEKARALLLGPSQTKASRESFRLLEEKRELQQERAKLK